MDLFLYLLAIAIPFQLLGVVAYFIGKKTSISRGKLLLILTPTTSYWFAFLVWMFIQPLVEGFWRDLDILFRTFCFIVGTIINLVLTLILRSILSKEQKENIVSESL
jgi:uncharacterized membrane protein